MRAVTEEKLGRGEATDLLGVSFSQVDTAGHNYGPDSHEVMDSVLRLDRIYIRGFRVEHAEVHHGMPWSRISDHAALSARLVRIG